MSDFYSRYWWYSYRDEPCVEVMNSTDFERSCDFSSGLMPEDSWRDVRKYLYLPIVAVLLVAGVVANIALAVILWRAAFCPPGDRLLLIASCVLDLLYTFFIYPDKVHRIVSETLGGIWLAIDQNELNRESMRSLIYPIVWFLDSASASSVVILSYNRLKFHWKGESMSVKRAALVIIVFTIISAAIFIPWTYPRVYITDACNKCTLNTYKRFDYVTRSLINLDMEFQDLLGMLGGTIRELFAVFIPLLGAFVTNNVVCSWFANASKKESMSLRIMNVLSCVLVAKLLFYFLIMLLPKYGSPWGYVKFRAIIDDTKLVIDLASRSVKLPVWIFFTCYQARSH